MSRVLLSVPYFSQMDNECDVDGPNWRQCASSACGMLAAFWKKVQSDEAYKDIRQRFGATTDPMAHVAALRHLGLQATFRTNGTASLLRQELDAQRPVAVGWLHHGRVSAPTGGGHWSTLIGYTSTSWLHHDPYGEADLVNGGYVTTAIGAGRSIAYSNKNWLPRWVPKKTDGWLITVRP